MKPYPYQQAVISGVYKCFHEGRNRVLVVAPTGSGKTILAGFIASQVLVQHKRVWFTAPLDALIDQTYDSFKEILANLGLPLASCGVIHPSYKRQYDRPIQVVAQKTAEKRLKADPSSKTFISPQYYPDLVIDDECHTTRFRAAAQEIIDITQPTFNVGLTGSPCRTSKYESFGRFYDDVVFSPSTLELTAMGKLAPLRFQEVYDVDSVTRVNHDGIIDDDEAKILYDTPEAIARMFALYKARGEDAKSIGFCIDVDHAKNCADYWNSQGIPAADINFKTPRKQRKRLIDDFKAGRLRALFGKDVLAVGFDCKDVVTALCMRPTMSLALWIQMIGRVRRAAPGKPYGIVLDYTGNCARHGYGEDEWLKFGKGEIRGILDPPKEKGDEDNPFLMLCQGYASNGCTHLMTHHVKICPKCGTEQIREVKEGPLPRTWDGAFIETVRPSTLNPENEAHAIRYYRYLRARAVLIHEALPGKARYDLIANNHFAHWADSVPRGQSSWTYGAIFQDVYNSEAVRGYYSFLTRKYLHKPELTPEEKQARIWYALEQEFDSKAISEFRIKLRMEKASAVVVPEPQPAPVAPKPARTVAMSW